MSLNRIIGIVILVMGIILVVLGLNATQGMGEKIVEGTTGNYTDKTMWFIIGGVAMILIGGWFSFMNRGKR